VFPEGLFVLEYVDIPDSVTNIDALAFGACETLATICIPGNIEFIAWYAFVDCSNLSEVYFIGVPPSAIGSSAFEGCNAALILYYPSSLEEFWMPNGEWVLGEDGTYMIGSYMDVLRFILYGDVNGDWDITAADAALILRWLVQLTTLSDEALERADLNRNGIINAADAAKILRYLVELEKSLDP